MKKLFTGVLIGAFLVGGGIAGAAKIRALVDSHIAKIVIDVKYTPGLDAIENIFVTTKSITIDGLGNRGPNTKTRTEFNELDAADRSAITKLVKSRGKDASIKGIGEDKEPVVPASMPVVD